MQLHSSDQGDRPRQRLLYVMSLALMGGGALFAVVSVVAWIRGQGTALDVLGAGVLVLVGLSIYLLQRSGRLRLAGFLLSLLLVLVPIYYVLVEGYKTTALLLFAGGIVFADLLIGGRSGLFAAALAIILYAGAGFINVRGWVPVHYSSPFLSDVVTVAVTAVGLALATGSFIEEMRRALRERDEREIALHAADEAKDRLLAELQGREQAQRQLVETIHELGSPIIPLARGVIAMPLIGTIDSDRAQDITSALLKGVAGYQARTVIIDITGVPVVDTTVAGALLRAAQGVRLLGAEPVLTGIRSEVAQTIVGLGLDLSGVITRSTIEEGLAHALQEEVGP